MSTPLNTQVSPSQESINLTPSTVHNEDDQGPSSLFMLAIYSGQDQYNQRLALSFQDLTAGSGSTISTQTNTPEISSTQSPQLQSRKRRASESHDDDANDSLAPGDDTTSGPSQKRARTDDTDVEDIKEHPEKAPAPKGHTKHQPAKKPEIWYETKNIGPSGPIYTTIPPKRRTMRFPPRPHPTETERAVPKPALPQPRWYLSELGEPRINTISGTPRKNIGRRDV